MIDLTQTPERLKQSIIGEAMHGKLTKQLPNDGSTDDLLKIVNDNRNKLINAKKIRNHHLPKVSTDDALFAIPKNWKWVRLGSLVSLNSGLSYKKKNLSKNTNDIRVIRGGNISNNGKLLLKDNDYRINNNVIKNSDVILKYGQLLTPVSTSPNHIAKMAIVPKLTSKIAAGGFVYQITPYVESHIFSKFLLYDLTYIRIKKEILKITHLSGSALCNLPKTKFIKILLPLPPLAEQKRIVQRLDQILPKIDGLNRDVVRLHSIRKAFPHRLKQSLLMEAMQGKLTKQLPSDGNADELLQKIQQKKQALIKAGKIRRHKLAPIIRVPFKIPSNWEWSRLNNVLDVRDGTHNTPRRVTNGVPLVTSKNIIHHHISFNNAKLISKKDALAINKRSKVCINDIIMPMIGTVGNPAINKSNGLFSIKNVALIKDNGFINIYFIYNYLLSISSYLKKDSSGAVQSFISLTKLRNLLIPIPPLSEQKRVVNKINLLFKLI